MNLSIVIPAFNENKDIITLINELQLVEGVSITVVDDHSEQEFAEMYKTIQGITLIRHEKNMGKSQALLTGIQAHKADFYLILDADLHGVSAHQIRLLQEIAPSYDVLCLVRGDDRELFKLAGATYITRGEHLLTQAFIEKYSTVLFDGTRWGFDNNINDIIRKKEVHFAFCELEGVSHKVKSEKYPFFTGLLLDLKMFYQVPIKKYKLIFWLSTYLSLLPHIRSRIRIPKMNT